MKHITEQFHSILPDGLFLAMGDIGSSFSEDLLSSSERKEYDTFKHRRRKDEFLSTRGVIKELAAEIGLDDSIFEIRKDGLGKPFGVYKNRQYNLSLAHTGNKVICGISESLPIGIDIEPVDRTVDERLQARILHPDERTSLDNEPIIRIWTLKEALVKLDGKGLRTNLNRLRLTPETQYLFSGRFDNEKSAKICSFQYCDHWIAIAYYDQQ